MGPDLPGMIPRLSAYIPLAISIFFHPIAPNEPIPRDDAAVLNKLIAEGDMSEVNLILGWLYDTRHLVVSPPPPQIHSLVRRHLYHHLQKICYLRRA